MSEGFWQSIAQIWTRRDLLRELVARELKIRYRRSVLGFGWSLLTPIYQIVIYTLVLKYLMHVGGKNLSVNILAAIIPWTFFSVGVTNSCSSVLRYRNVVKKVYFPRHMLPLATVFANLIHLLLSTLVLFAVFLAIPVIFHTTFLLLIPLVICQTFLVAGLSFIAACAHTYYQDVEYVLGNLMQVGMFLTPVLYPASSFNRLLAPYRAALLLNPMAAYTEGWRGALLRAEGPDPLYFGIAVGVSLAVFLVGLAIWRRYQWRFPEVL